MLTDLKLPEDHPVRNLPDDFRLYQLIVVKLRSEPKIDYMTLVGWAYDTARSEHLPGEVVSKMLACVRVHEGLGR